jgi:MFS family permease
MNTADVDERAAGRALDRFTGGLGPTFVRMWAQRGVVNLADGVLVVSAGLLAVGLTRSPLEVSLVSAAATLPWLLTTLFAGVVADRYDRRLVMLAANAARVAALAAGVAAVASGALSVPLLCALALVLGTAEVFHDTCAQSMVPSLVPKDRLEAANGRLLTTEQVANSFLGAPLAGPLVALGAGWALGAPALLYLAGGLLLLGVRGRFRAQRVAGTAPSTVRAEIVDGLRFVVRHRVIRTLTLVAGTANAASSAFFAVFVLWVVGPGSAMGASPQVYGLLVACLAVGAVAGPALASRVVRRYGSVRLLQPTWIANALVMLVPVLVPQVWAACVAFVLLGATNVMGNVMQMSMRQRMVPDHLMGRVQAAGRFVGRGLDPVGAVLGGLAGAAFGLPPVFVGAVVVIVVGQLLAMRVVTPQAALDAQEEADRAERELAAAAAGPGAGG